MPTQEERLSTLEHPLAFLQKKSGVEIQDLNRNMTVLREIRLRTSLLQEHSFEETG